MKKNLFFRSKKLWAIAVALMTAFPMLAANQAKIGNTEYATLQAAINAANTGETVTLMTNVTSAVTISGKSLTLDLNGKNISKSPKALTISDGSTVTITGNGTINGGNQYALYLDGAKGENHVTVTGSVNFLTTYMWCIYGAGGTNYLTMDSNYTGNVTAKDYGPMISSNSKFIINIYGGNYTAYWHMFDGNQLEINIYGGNFTIPDESKGGQCLFFSNVNSANSIHGGTFSGYCHMNESYIAEDCEMAQNSDGSYTVADYTVTPYYTTGDHDTQSSKTALTGSTISLADSSYYSFVVPAEEAGKTITYTRTFKNNNYNAWYMPFELNASDYSDKVTFYDITGVTETDEGWSVQIKETSGKIEANTPYVVKSNSSTSSQVTFSLTDATLNKTESHSVTKTSDKGSSFTFTGIYTKKFVQDGTGWYGLSGGKFSKQVNASSGNYLNPFRFYLTITGSAASKANIGGFNIADDNDPTGISNVNVETQKDNVIYDLQGRRVNNPTKGLYIVNGKKVLVK